MSARSTTATQIKSSYTPLDMKANGFEYQCIEFVQGILKLQGIDATPQFKRDKIANYQEETSIILQSANYLDDETILKHLPFLTPDEIDDILARKEEEEAERYKIAEQISQGKGFNEQADTSGQSVTENVTEGENPDEQEERKENVRGTQKSGQNTVTKGTKNK